MKLPKIPYNKIMYNRIWGILLPSVFIVWFLLLANSWINKAYQIELLNNKQQIVYVIDKKTMDKIDNIHVLALQNMKENQRLRQYFDKESEK